MNTLSRRLLALEGSDGGKRMACIFKPEGMSCDAVLAERNAARAELDMDALDASNVAFVTFKGL